MALAVDRPPGGGEAPGPSVPAAPPRVDLGVVVVTYNSRHHIDRCLDAVAASTAAGDLAVQVVVADNASADGTAGHVAHRHPEVVVLPMGRNAGFAVGSNAAMARTDARHVLLLNPDTEVQPGALAALVAFADANPGAGVVAPRLCHPDGTDQGTARAFPTPAAALFGRRSPLTRAFPGNRWSAAYLRPDGGDGHEPFRCDWVSGACLLVPRAVVEQVGGLDEEFFLFWEDADWCRRIVDAGHEVWTVPDAVVLHHEGGTRGHGWPVPAIRHFHRGAYLYWRNHHAPQPWNPARWLAAGALAGRGAVLAARSRLTDRRRPAPADDAHRPTGAPPATAPPDGPPPSAHDPGAPAPDDPEVM